MYSYKVKLCPEACRTQPDLSLEDTIETLITAAKQYNTASATALNRKYIDIDSISVEGATITLILHSSVYLSTPVKALRTFISDLSKTKEFSALITERGRMFASIATPLEGKKVSAELSDEELLKAVVELVCRETPENREKLDRIKEVICEAKKEE